MNQMRLWGMSGSFQTLVETQQDLTYDEVVAMLVEACLLYTSDAADE